MKAELLPFQHDGANFLAERTRAALFDEMRVGKTPQGIRACDITGVLDVLVLCPSIARMNWLREFWKFSKRDGVVVTSRNDKVDHHLTICSYDLLIHVPIYNQLAKPWGAVILDEAHFLKTDPELSKRSDAAWKIGTAARYCWALTGTPLPNGNADELYNLLRAFGVVGCSRWRFIEQFCVTSRDGTKVVANKNVDALKKLLAPITLRRKLKEVAPDMPGVRWATVAVEPGEVSSEAILTAAREIDPNCASAKSALARARKGADTLAAALDEAREQIESMDLPDSLLFRRLCGLQKVQPVVDLVQSELDAGLQRIVIFAWHRDVLASIAARLGFAVLDGGTPDTLRNQIIADFEAGTLKGICAQIIAAGTAINLSTADDVLFVEQDWNPANNAQATMRVVSQFKTRPVLARAVAVANSIDERLQASLQRKTRMVSEVFH